MCVQDDSSYLLTLVLGSVAGAAAIKYGSILLPNITSPNIVQALLMVSLPLVAAVLLLLKASSKEDWFKDTHPRPCFGLLELLISV
jgi:hypothetical protein